MITIIRELPVTETGAQQVLVQHDGHDGRFYVVSSVVAYSGFETLVFPADEDGNVTNWGEISGGRGMSREEAIEELASRESDGHPRDPAAAR